MSDDAGRVWYTGNTDDAGRKVFADADNAQVDFASLVVALPHSRGCEVDPPQSKQ